MADNPAPERAAFAAAQARSAAHIARMDKARESLGTIEEARTAAYTEFAAAEDALRKAEESSADPAMALARALGEAGLPPLAELRQHVEAASAVYQGVCNQASILKREIDRVDAADRTEYVAREALGALLAASPGVRGLLAELHATRRRCVTLEGALTEIARVPGALRPHWDALRREDELPDPELAEQWSAAILALLQGDGTAKIPGDDPQPEAAKAA